MLILRILCDKYIHYSPQNQFIRKICGDKKQFSPQNQFLILVERSYIRIKSGFSCLSGKEGWKGDTNSRPDMF
jgi:hypothetical protein